MTMRKSPVSWVCKLLVILAVGITLVSLLLLDPLMFSVLDYSRFQNSPIIAPSVTDGPVEGIIHVSNSKEKITPIVMYQRLLSLASSALAQKELRDEPPSLWKEPISGASSWKPCANRTTQKNLDKPISSNGYILVSAYGGLNQQRLAACNAVAVAALLNATLVVPRFLYCNIWKDPSQFGDIFQEDYFIDTMNDINIVKELPPHLSSLDLEAIGSVITGLGKEAKPDDYIRVVLPPLLRNGVVHLLGFANALAFDPLPSQILKLRCKCNFHALKFVPKIQKLGSLIVKRMRKYDFSRNMLDRHLLGNFLQDTTSSSSQAKFTSKYLALHLRFEVDMVAHSLCEFGGGEKERRELQAYREAYFKFLPYQLNNSKARTPTELRRSGRCPLTPEESALVLTSLGFKQGTYIYVAGSNIYGGKSRMKPFTNLYPNVVTKEDLLTDDELQPLKNFSSQLAALDFIACATADAFAITDTGSQMSIVVAGFRTYFGEGQAPTFKPNYRGLASTLEENGTISWSEFEDRVNKMLKKKQRVRVRRYGQNLYMLPTDPACMCRSP